MLTSLLWTGTVVLACRNLERGEVVKQQAIVSAKAAGIVNPQVDVMHLDLQSLASVRSFVKAFEQSGKPLHILVNNAGIYDITGDSRLTSSDFDFNAK